MGGPGPTGRPYPTALECRAVDTPTGGARGRARARGAKHKTSSLRSGLAADALAGTAARTHHSPCPSCRRAMKSQSRGRGMAKAGAVGHKNKTSSLRSGLTADALAGTAAEPITRPARPGGGGAPCAVRKSASGAPAQRSWCGVSCNVCREGERASPASGLSRHVSQSPVVRVTCVASPASGLYLKARLSVAGRARNIRGIASERPVKARLSVAGRACNRRGVTYVAS